MMIWKSKERKSLDFPQVYERQKFNVDHKEFWLATEGVKRKLILSRSSVWLDLARSRCLWVTLTPATHSIVKQDLVWFAGICCKLWWHSSMEVWWITRYNMAEYGRVMPWFLWKRWGTLTAAHPLVSSQLTHHPLNLSPTAGCHFGIQVDKQWF